MLKFQPDSRFMAKYKEHTLDILLATGKRLNLRRDFRVQGVRLVVLKPLTPAEVAELSAYSVAYFHGVEFHSIVEQPPATPPLA